VSTPVIAVQCTASDLLSSGYQAKRGGGLAAEDPASYAVGALRDAAVAPIVLAAPDLEENRTAIPELAERWGVTAFLGDELDTVSRLLGAARAAGADVIARVVLPSFYVEPQLVADQLERLEATGAEYCALPRDFNINFGADVVRTSALERLAASIDRLPELLRGTARYRPWPFFELDPEHFDVTVLDAVPEIGPDRVAWIRAQRNWPERSGPGFEGGEYQALATDYVQGTDAVLDAGCGHGEITDILSRHAASAMGVDYDAAMVALARERFPDCAFEAADLQRWSRPQAFDVIFHTHTLEHCADAVGTLANLRTSLAPGGRLIVEVPLQLRPGIINPHHEREYTVATLTRELEQAGLRIVETRGVCRGIYGPPDVAREAFLAVCVDPQEAVR
jgi:spore coat polysaccharide biosynthesis protein SpsF (cytidylyltransferase family)